MSESKPCIRCGRGIDAWSKICPFCNQNQHAPVPAATAQPREVAEYKPPEEFDLKKKAIGGGIGVLALIAAFGVGMLINRDGAPKNAPDTVEQQLEQEAQEKKAGPVRRADTPLVPTNEPGGVEQPITSAPAAVQPGATPNDWQRTDATAVSATEYQEMARRARAEKDRMAAVVDPRSLTGPAYAQAPRAVRPRPTTPSTQAAPASAAPSTVAPQTQSSRDEPRRASRGALRTRPVPEYQPLPEIRGRGTARLSLLIGADGRVRQVDIAQPLPGNTAQLVRAVQSWRFKPATENGEPVAAPYTVEISFR